MCRKAENWDMCPARIEPDTETYAGRFAVRLRSLREKAKLTPEEVAEKLGVSLSTIYSWERGFTFPKPEQLLLLMVILDLKSVRALFPER
jgi:transcriptional regulator with XRE-family HTH domain